MSDKHLFHFGALVTAATGRLVCSIGDLYKVLNFMTGDSLMTHQLPAAAKAVKSDLYAQHPWLSDVVVPDTIHDQASCDAWLDPAIAQWGEWHELIPNPAAWGSHDPIEDFVNAGGDPAKVIVVEADSDGVR